MEHELAKLCVWREARSQELEGIIAVCWVIRNRMKLRNKASFEIVSERMQFSSMTIPSDPQLFMYPTDLQMPSFKTVCQAFDGVMACPEEEKDLGKMFSDNTGGALYYRNIANSTSIWFDSAVRTGKIVKTVSIGLHTFYKEAPKAQAAEVSAG